MSKRYFINNLDTRFGKALLGELVKEPPETPVHLCTMRTPGLIDKPVGIRKILKREKPKLSRKKMLEETDVHIFDVHDTDMADIQFAVSVYAKLPPEEQKVLILVSDIVTWGESPPKIKKKQAVPPPDQKQDGETKPADQDQADPESSQINKEEQKQDMASELVLDQGPPQYTFYEDSDYKSRVPLKAYSHFKEMEDTILACKKDGLKVIVICGGVRYGQGEYVFHDLFKAAWLQQPEVLPYLGAGDNLIPTIHIQDLVKFVIKVAESPPEESGYLLAFDKAVDRRQKSIIQSISRTIGSGKIAHCQKSPIIPFEAILGLDINIQASKLLIGTVEQPVEFDWTCPKGIQQNCEVVLNQFCKTHQLRPLNLLMLCSQDQRQKTLFNNLVTDLSKHYRIPVINLEKILKEARSSSDSDLSQFLQEQKEGIQEYLSKGQEQGQLTQAMKAYYKAIKWRLSQNDCKNRGYILDNFPKFEKQADVIFTPMGNKLKQKPKPKKKTPPPVSAVSLPSQPQLKQQDAPAGDEPKDAPEGEPAPEAQPEPEPEPEEEEGSKPKRESFYPESVITLKDLKVKRETRFAVSNYLSSKGTETYIFDSCGRDQYESFQSIRIYVERNGCPNNYLIGEDELQRRYHEHYEKLNVKEEEARKAASAVQSKQEQQVREQREKLSREQLEYILGNEAQLELTKNIPFRVYLMEYVVPVLNEGLLEVSNIIPDDPVELLAEYLFSKSNEA